MRHCENLFHSVLHARTVHWGSLQQFSGNLVSYFTGKLLKLLPPDVRV